jgi:hypothetical protein
VQFYDRLTGQTHKSLPEQLLIGQWQILTQAETATVNAVPISPSSRLYIFPDVTKRFTVQLEDGSREELLVPAWQIPSDLLLNSLQHFERTLKTLSNQSDWWQDWVNTLPLVHDIEENICLHSLEEFIEKYLGHLEEICRCPRTYLKMEVERLPISRAQRISSHATEFLAAHTEDWEKRTFRSIRPKKVLCLIREDQLDIYENRVVACLIDHLLEYLQCRISEVKALQRELQQADDFSKDIKHTYWRNRDRICSLWGEQFQAGTALKTAEETFKLLQQLHYKLQGLIDTELYRSIPRQANVGNTLKRTNILVNDQHYRYVNHLWQVWSTWKRGHRLAPQQLIESYQRGFTGFEAFCFLLVSRALTGNQTANDQGLGFEVNKLDHLKLNDLIQVNSTRGCIRLKRQLDGSILLEADKIQNLRLIPLMLPLTSADDVDTTHLIYEKLRTAYSNKRNETVVILCPGTEDERQKLPESIQQKVNSLGNECNTVGNSSSLLAVSPLDIFSVERVARAIQWWLYSKYCQIYPFTVEEKIHISLLNNSSWILKEEKQYKLYRPPQQEERASFDSCLSQLINQARSRGAQSRGELLELQNLNHFSAQVGKRFEPILTCPTCYQLSDHFESLDRRCFHCRCKDNRGCRTEWGTRACRRCDERYPYVQLSDPAIYDNFRQQQIGYVDRIFGRDVLAIPCHEGAQGFICPSCGACS